MKFKTILPDQSISLFVKSILVFEETGANGKTVLPFFADGYPGLMFQETETGLTVQPHNKLMPKLFLYGQTIHPIELVMTGNYKLIVFQLYPFVLKSFFNVNPQEVNDNCYDLQKLENNKGTQTITQLQRSRSLSERIETITSLLHSLFIEKQKELDLSISEAIKQIIAGKGRLMIAALSSNLNLTERTFERRFIKAVGITAKQFSKIIQFQNSLEQLKVKDFTKLTDIVYSNGFADQSHFIKVFKAFTGKTPLAFRSQH